MPNTFDGSILDTIFTNPLYTTLFCLAVIWAGIWKGFALWRAARLKMMGWYIALLILNTIGILEIIFLIATRNKEEK